MLIDTCAGCWLVNGYIRLAARLTVLYPFSIDVIGVLLPSISWPACCECELLGI